MGFINFNNIFIRADIITAIIPKIASTGIQTEYVIRLITTDENVNEKKLEERYLSKRAFGEVFFSSISLSSEPTDCRTLLNSPALILYFDKSIAWNFIPRSLKYRSVFFVSKHLGFPKIWMFTARPPAHQADCCKKYRAQGFRDNCV